MNIFIFSRYTHHKRGAQFPFVIFLHVTGIKYTLNAYIKINHMFVCFSSSNIKDTKVRLCSTEVLPILSNTCSFFQVIDSHPPKFIIQCSINLFFDLPSGFYLIASISVHTLSCLSISMNVQASQFFFL